MPKGDNPKSRKNLTKLTTEEARKRGKSGGQKSAIARQARKTLREELLALLEDGDTQERISLALIDQAANGNTKAFEIIRDTVGEKPTEKIAVASVNEEAVSKLQDAIRKRRENEANTRTD